MSWFHCRRRFDFSFNRAMSVAELAEVEATVQRAVQASLPVYNEVVPLKSAMEIAGLRAVFGEKYPDPVRVVSFGNKVHILLSGAI